MKYLLVLDYDHLDMGGFLKELARTLGSTKNGPWFILHGDSAYTQRIVESGVMSDEAKIRSIKELNHRLTALLADEGVPVIAINGFQRDIISQNQNGGIKIDATYLNSLNKNTSILCSSLISDGNEGVIPAGLPELANALQIALDIDEVLVFDANDKGTSILTDQNGNRNDRFPREFDSAGKKGRLIRTGDIRKL